MNMIASNFLTKWFRVSFLAQATPKHLLQLCYLSKRSQAHNLGLFSSLLPCYKQISSLYHQRLGCFFWPIVKLWNLQRWVFLIKISSARFEWTLKFSSRTYHRFDKVHWHTHWCYCHSLSRPTPPHTDIHIWILSLHNLHTDKVKIDIHWSPLHTMLLCNLWKTEEITAVVRKKTVILSCNLQSWDHGCSQKENSHFTQKFCQTPQM